MTHTKQQISKETEIFFAPQNFRFAASKYINARRDEMEAIESMWKNLKLCRRYLTKAEYMILRERWVKHRTLEEIGKENKVTRERIRQIEYKAIEKLKAADPLPYTSRNIPI